MAKIKINDAKELIQRNIKCGVVWIERAYNKCENDLDIIRLAEQIRETDANNKAKFSSFVPNRNFR